MFGLKIPSGADTVVQIRLTVSRGRPPVVWQGSLDLPDDAVTVGLLAKQNVAAYLWAALHRGKLQEDDLGFAHIPARVVAMRHGEIVFDEKVSIPLMMPRRGAPAPTPSYHAQRDMLTIVETALSTMQRNALEAIAQVSSASINALRAINAAQAASMKRAQQTLERIGAMLTDAHRMQAQAHAQAAQEAPQIPEAVSAESPQGQRRGPSQAQEPASAPLAAQQRSGAVTRAGSVPFRRVEKYLTLGSSRRRCGRSETSKTAVVWSPIQIPFRGS